ncbi:MAG: hypothetical protein AB1705_25730, partial [Verrucomicrobiota bacterium]
FILRPADGPTLVQPQQSFKSFFRYHAPSDYKVSQPLKIAGNQFLEGWLFPECIESPATFFPDQSQIANPKSAIPSLPQSQIANLKSQIPHDHPRR